MMNLDIENYRIIDIVDERYDDREVNTLDFTLHLNCHTCLDKKIERRQSDYRPLYAYYHTGGVYYARRRFEFTLAPSGLVAVRVEYLAYYLLDGTLGDEFIIRYREYDHMNVDQLAEAICEQTKLRTDIVNHIKGMIMGIVQAHNPEWSVQQIILETQPFFNEFTTERIDFVEVGSSDYKDAVTAIDLETTPHTYLATEVAVGITLKDYIISMT